MVLETTPCILGLWAAPWACIAFRKVTYESANLLNNQCCGDKGVRAYCQCAVHESAENMRAVRCYGKTCTWTCRNNTCPFPSVPVHVAVPCCLFAKGQGLAFASHVIVPALVEGPLCTTPPTQKHHIQYDNFITCKFVLSCTLYPDDHRMRVIARRGSHMRQDLVMSLAPPHLGAAFSFV